MFLLKQVELRHVVNLNQKEREVKPVFFKIEDVISCTEKAILVRWKKKEVWLPKSQILYTISQSGNWLHIMMPEWLYDAKIKKVTKHYYGVPDIDMGADWDGGCNCPF